MVHEEICIIYLFIFSSILFLHTCMFPACDFPQRTCVVQGLVNGFFSMRLEFTRVCGLNGFQFVMGSYGCHSSHFLRVCLPQSALPLICFWYIYIYIYILSSTDRPVSFYPNSSVWLNRIIYIYIYIYIYISLFLLFQSFLIHISIGEKPLWRCSRRAGL